MKAHRWWAFQCPSAHSFPFLVLYRCILEKQGICWGLSLHVSMRVLWSGNISPLICPLLHSSQTPSHYTHETRNRPTDRSREGSTESQLRIFLPFYTRSMKLLLSAAQQTYPCSESFPGVRVSLRKTSVEATTSYFYPLHLVCGLKGLCCYAGGEQWNSSDDDFWAHMWRQLGGGRQESSESQDGWIKNQGLLQKESWL